MAIQRRSPTFFNGTPNGPLTFQTHGVPDEQYSSPRPYSPRYTGDSPGAGGVDYLNPGQMAPHPDYIDAVNRTDERAAARRNASANFARSIAINNGGNPRDYPVAGAPAPSPQTDLIVGGKMYNIPGSPVSQSGTAGIVPGPSSSPTPVNTYGGSPASMGGVNIQSPSYSQEQIKHQHLALTYKLQKSKLPLGDPSSTEYKSAKPQADALDELIQHHSRLGGLYQPSLEQQQSSYSPETLAGGPTDNFAGTMLGSDNYMRTAPTPSATAPMPTSPTPGLSARAGTDAGAARIHPSEQIGHMLWQTIKSQNPNVSIDQLIPHFVERMQHYGVDPQAAHDLVTGWIGGNVPDRQETYTPGSRMPLSMLGPSNGLDSSQRYGNGPMTVPGYRGSPGIPSWTGQQSGPGMYIEAPGTVSRGPYPGYTPISSSNAPGMGPATTQPTTQPAATTQPMPTTRPSQNQQMVRTQPLGGRRPSNTRNPMVDEGRQIIGGTIPQQAAQAQPVTHDDVRRIAASVPPGPNRKQEVLRRLQAEGKDVTGL